jgi:hypothetical protein
VDGAFGMKGDRLRPAIGQRTCAVPVVQQLVLVAHPDVDPADEDVMDLCPDLQRIAVGHHQIGDLADLDGPEFIADPGDLRRIPAAVRV